MDAKGNQSLQEHRESLGLSRMDMAVELGLSLAFIYQVERGRRGVSPTTARKFAAAYGVNLGELYELIELERIASRVGEESKLNQ